MIAVYIDNALERYDHEIKYSFDFIFKTLGYEFKYISRIDQLLNNDILVFYGITEPNLKEAYILAMRKIMLYIPCDQELLTPGSMKQKDLKSWQKKLNLDKAIPVLSFNDFEVPVRYYQDEELFYGAFKFDPVGNIFVNLTNYGVAEEEGEIIRENLILNDQPLIPVTNYLCWLIEQCLIDAVQSRPNYYLVKKEYWPQGESGAFAISHNVNKLRKWNAKKIMKSSYEDLLFFYKIKYLFDNLISKLKYITTNIEEYWNFDLIQQIEGKYDIHSTYFWGTESEVEEDVDYKISSKEVCDEIENIRESSNEIALLASRRSYNNDILKRQKQKIMQIALREKVGVRQNGYLHDPNVSEELLSKHSFAYSSSRISIENPGYVNGVGFPFHTYLDRGQKKENGFYCYKNLEIPLVFSDDQLLLSKIKVISEENAKDIINDLMDSINIPNGLLTFNFSVSNFTELDYLIDLYPSLLTSLSDRNFYKGTFLEIADWWRRRENMEITEYHNTIDLYFPERINNCTLSIHGNVKVSKVIGLDAEIEGNCIKLKDVMPDKKIQIILAASGE